MDEEQPPPQPARVRPDAAGADVASLVRLGRVEPPPTPRPEPPVRPGVPPPLPVQNPAAQAHRVMLTDALRESGVTPAPRDTAAVEELAGLSSGAVSTVMTWIRRGKPATPGPPA